MGRPAKERSVWSTGRWRGKGAVGNFTRNAAQRYDGKHWDREQNLLERPHASEDGDKVIADGTSHAHQREKKRFSSRGWDEPRNITSRRSPFREITDRPATARGNIKKHIQGGTYSIQADFEGKLETAATAQVTVRQAARQPIGRQQRWATSTEQPITFSHVAILNDVCSFMHCSVFSDATLLVSHARF